MQTSAQKALFEPFRFPVVEGAFQSGLEVFRSIEAPKLTQVQATKIVG